MTTPRIEEIERELIDWGWETEGARGAFRHDQMEKVRKALTEARQAGQEESNEDIRLLAKEIERLREDVEIARKAGRDEAVEVFEQFIEDIPEAYGWGKEDEEADRGYQICLKNVKVMGRKTIKALQDNK